MAEKTDKDEKSKAGKNHAASFIKELLSGSMVSEKIILSNLGYVTLVTVLLSFYIGNRFHAEKVTRQMSKLQKEVKDLRAEALSISTDLMYVSRQSEVYKLVRERGLNLEELKTPPYRLLVNSKDSKWQSGTK